ncbi:MAG: A/G-specific adenine glycosylase [Gammaproteobacteria bacterium]|nr:A/G-specific adenine glycosylase [Gammaproteobacteria bacterium]MCG3142857.1 Adenine DNA glycosylase [Gammaproteobacteria bacterium]
MQSDRFAPALLRWFDGHGRTQLPWQHERSPYRVWLSEIMLQQTQVATVIPYYERFLARFPDVRTLAAAPLDDVLALWAGLGYYARARNLHRCAEAVVRAHGGEFPHDIDALTTLPGIGRSTAGAILAFSSGQRHPILDGNVRRVLARYHAVEGPPSAGAVENRLWEFADLHTPAARVADYTQAIMDLGATVCTRTGPRCAICPLARDCRACNDGAVDRYPAARARKQAPVRSRRFLIVRRGSGHILLEARPPTGIWGGLWSLPEIDTHAGADSWCEAHGLRVRRSTSWAVMRHTFSHFHLDIHPLLLEVKTSTRAIMDGDRWLWYKDGDAIEIGLPAPVRRLLDRLDAHDSPEARDDPHRALRKTRQDR